MSRPFQATVAAALLVVASSEISLGFVRPFPRPETRSTRRYSATIVPNQQQSSSWDDRKPPADLKFPSVNADFDTWFWGAQAEGGVESAVFAKDDRAVILFDGICNFCNEGVNFFMAMDRDPRRGSFRFAAMQGEIGQQLMKTYGEDPEARSSIVLIEPDGHHYTKSTAVLRIAARLRDPFPQLSQVASVFPMELRDAVYDVISRNRHIFGEKDSCRIPEDEELERFMD